MKKLVLLLAVTFSVSLFSCGGADNKATEDTTATDTVAVVEEVAAVVENCDSCANDSCAADSCANCACEKAAAEVAE